MFWELFKKKKVQRISPKEVKAKLDRKEAFLLLDVRSPDEYARGHINQSISMPLGTIEQQISRHASSKTAEIVVYCQSGARASRAAAELAELGYTNIKNMGGIAAWPYEVVR